MKRHFIFGYRNHSRDGKLEGYRIVSVPPFASAPEHLQAAIDDVNNNSDRSEPVIITFVAKL